MKRYTLALLTLLSATACGGSIKVPGSPEAINLSDLCGSSSNCGLSGKVVFVGPSLPLLTGDPNLLIGAHDDHTKKDWAYRVPSPCAQHPKTTEKVITDSAIEYTSDETAKLNARLILALQAEISGAEASIDFDALRSRLTSAKLRAQVSLISANDTDWPSIRSDKTCQDSMTQAYARRQMAVLKLSGESAQQLKSALKLSIKGKASGAATADAGAASANLSAEFSSATEKAVATVIAENTYLLGISYED